MRVLLVTGEGIRDHVLACRVCVVRRRKAPSCTQGDIMVSGFFLILFRAFHHLHPCSSAHVCLMLAHLHTACPILIGMLRTYTANAEENPVPRTRNEEEKTMEAMKRGVGKAGIALTILPEMPVHDGEGDDILQPLELPGYQCASSLFVVWMLVSPSVPWCLDPWDMERGGKKERLHTQGHA